MNASPILASLCLGITIPTAADARSDWPQWQGPTRDAISTESGLLGEWPDGGPPLAWRIDTLGGGYGGLAVTAGRIFGMSKRGEEEVVWALSEADGKEVWATSLGEAPEGGMPQGIEGPGCTPTVDGERLYVLGYGGELACLKTADGGIVWQRNLVHDFGGHLPVWRYNESPLIDGDKLICTPGGNDATLVALDKHTGEPVWKSVLPGHTDDSEGPDMMGTMPALVALDKDGDKELSAAEIEDARAVLSGLDKNGDGKLEEAELRAESDGGARDDRRRRRRGGGVMRSLKVHAGLDADESGEVDAGELERAVESLRKLDENSDGKLVEDEVGQRFRAPRRSGAGYSSAIAIEFGGVRQYVQFTSKALVGVAADDGRLLWRYDKPANRNGINCSTPIHLDGKVCAASAYGAGGALARLVGEDDGSFRAEEVWSTRDMQNQHGGMVVIDGCLYGANGGNGGGFLVCLDFETGEVLWNDKDRDGDQVRKASMAVADGMIYYRTEDEGTVLLIEPSSKKYIERGRFGQPDRSRQPAWTHPVIANGRLYIRDQERLFCYTVKK